MDRGISLSAVAGLARERWDILAIRLNEEILAQETGFHLHLMRQLSQELSGKENLSKAINDLISEYMHPFELAEKVRRYGIEWVASLGREDKLVRREKSSEEIRANCTLCLDQMVQLELRPIVIFESVEKMSSPSEQFLIDFLIRNRNEGVAFLGGHDPGSLQEFVVREGLHRYFSVAFVGQDETREGETGMGFEESQTEARSDAARVASLLVSAFAVESLKFNFLKFDVRHQLAPADLEDVALDFDLCLLGHLKMRADYPQLVRTDYDCAFLIKVADSGISDTRTITSVTDAAYRMLVEAVVTRTGSRFEPWDTWIFLMAPFIDEQVVQNYRHQGYRNVFVLLPNGEFHNFSPHQWMNPVLSNVAHRWARGA